jgi:hypothetical protein
MYQFCSEGLSLLEYEVRLIGVAIDACECCHTAGYYGPQQIVAGYSKTSPGAE